MVGSAEEHHCTEVLARMVEKVTCRFGVGFAAVHGACVYTQMPRSLCSKASSVGNSCLNSTGKYLANHMLTCLSC